jgi:hypothetical protein|tara:strand:+ start:10716 stop:11483 length:768 start_codon:yes stop_codon:yes gene_type:complete
MLLHLLQSFIYRAEGDNGAPSDPPAGDGGAGDATFTQTDVDRIVGERLARAEATFATKHDLESLTAKAAELDGIHAKAAADKEDRDRAALVRTGDVDKITAQFEERLAAKDTALETVTASTETALKQAYSSIAMARVGDQLHEEAKPSFAALIEKRLGVKFDVETGQASVFAVGEGGQPAYDATGDPLTIDATVDGLLKANAFMRKPAAAGSGAAPAPGGAAPAPASEALQVAEQAPKRDNLVVAMQDIMNAKPA